MKKFTGLFLSILMLLSVCAFSVSADDSPVSGSVAANTNSKMYGNFSDTIWNFSGLDSYTGYVSVYSGDMNGYFALDQTFLQQQNNASASSSSKVEYDETTQSMKLTGNQGNAATAFVLLNSMLNVKYSNVNVRFTAKADSTHKQMYVFIRNDASSAQYPELVRMGSDNRIYLCSVPVAKYDSEKWYTLDLRLDLTTRYARLYVTEGRSEQAMKGNATETTKFYDVSFDALYEKQSGGTYAELPNNFIRLGLGFEHGKDAVSTWYVGEWYQNTMTNAPRPTYESLNSDFSGTKDENIVDANTERNPSGYTTLDAQKKWGSGNPELTDIADGVAVVKSKADNGAKARINRTPFKDGAPKRRHRIDVRVGGEAGSSVSLLTNSGNYTISYLKSKTEMQLANGDAQKDKAASGMSTGYTSAQVAMPEGEKTPLRVKIFYDESQRKGVVGVESNGSFTCSEFTIPSTDTSVFTGISLYAAENGQSAYYDDFTWDITPSAVTVEEAAKIAYTDATAANLDETVTFTYSETLRQTADKVTVTSGETPVETPYTVSYDDNKLIVHFSELAPNTSYTVSAPSLTTLSGLSTESLTQATTFTTVDSTYSATKPKMEGNAVTSTLSAPYAAEKSATLLVAVYNADGSLNTVTSTSKTIARDGDGTMSVSLPTVPTGGSWKAFVWDGMSNLKPLCEAGEASVNN